MPTRHQYNLDTPVTHTMIRDTPTGDTDIAGRDTVTTETTRRTIWASRADATGATNQFEIGFPALPDHGKETRVYVVRGEIARDVQLRDRLTDVSDGPDKPWTGQVDAERRLDRRYTELTVESLSFADIRQDTTATDA